jgi:heterotetrameric sarcosine oxidase delta subunit
VGFLITCPNCGERSYTEFWFGGEVPDPADDDFGRVWLRRNVAGAQLERWFHSAGCRRWLTLERDTRTNEIQRVIAREERAGAS